MDIKEKGQVTSILKFCALVLLCSCILVRTSFLFAENRGALAIIKNVTPTLSFKVPTKEIKGIEALGIKKSFGNLRGKTETLIWRLEKPEKEISWHKLSGYDQIIIKNLSAKTLPGEPSLPVKNFTITLPLNAKVNGIEVTDIEYVEIENSLKVLPTPRPRRFSSSRIGKGYLIPNPKIYKRKEFFPGNIASYELLGRDNKNSYVRIDLYPLQYIPAKGRAILITSAKIILYYQ